MNRTRRLKLAYAVLLLAGLGFAVAIVRYGFPDDRKLGFVVAMAFLLLPGQLQSLAFRPFFRGRVFLQTGRYKEAVEQFHLFLDRLREQPWKKKLLWLRWTVYTTNVEAMTWNNIGAAHTNAGNWDDAKQALLRALALDAKYPLPHHTLATIALVDGDRPEAERRLKIAKDLGYTASSVDELINQLQTVLAKREARLPHDEQRKRS